MDHEHQDLTDLTRRSLLAAFSSLALAGPDGAQGRQGRPKSSRNGKKGKKKGQKPKPKPRLFVVAHVTEIVGAGPSDISVRATGVGMPATPGEPTFTLSVGAFMPRGSAKAMRAKLAGQLRIRAAEIVPVPLETIAVVLL